MAKEPVAIVTGGAQGLGAAIVEVLLKDGYKVCVADLQEEKGQQYAKKLQQSYGTQNVAFIVCDVTKEEDYKKVFDFTMKEFSRLDVVVNNAGILNEKNPRKTLEVNLMGPIIGCQMALEYMGKSKGGKGGIVINTASIAGFLPFTGSPVYCATKHGVVGLTRSYGKPEHLEKDGIIFSAICPFFIETAILDSIHTSSLATGFDPHKSFDVMTPEYVAQAVLKLLEDRINGSTLVVTQNRGYEYIGLQEVFKEYNINI